MNAVLGHEWAVKNLLTGIETDRVSHATLIVGAPNIGKTTLARTFAQALNCVGELPRPCGQCIACQKISHGTHPDVRVLEAPFPPTTPSPLPSQTLKIDHIRDLQRDLSLSPYEGRWRVAILCEFERATPEAANALLKTLEEPPPHVVLVLTASESEALLPTIVSRCQILSLRPLPLSRVREGLASSWGVDEEQAGLLAHLSAGRLGWAVQAWQDDAILTRRNEVLEEMISLPAKSTVDRFAYAANLSKRLGRKQNPDDYPRLARETLGLWMSWWRDVLLLVSGSEAALTNVDRLEMLRQQANQLTLQQAKAIMAQLQAVINALDRNVNLQLAIEVFVLNLPHSMKARRI